MIVDTEGDVVGKSKARGGLRIFKANRTLNAAGPHLGRRVNMEWEFQKAQH